jgi:hypothetical protein
MNPLLGLFAPPPFETNSNLASTQYMKTTAKRRKGGRTLVFRAPVQELVQADVDAAYGRVFERQRGAILDQKRDD